MARKSFGETVGAVTSKAPRKQFSETINPAKLNTSRAGIGYGPGGLTAGGALGGGLGDIGRKINPWDTTKTNELSKEGERNAQEQYDRSQPIMKGLNEADDQYRKDYKYNTSNYKSSRDSAINSYLQKSGQLQQEASDQAGNALKANMESAMSLQEAGDPNNKIQTAVRGMYDQQGQKARVQGQQDFGVLSALGAQAAGQQFGASAPMTAGMQGQIYAQNQGQAGNAFAAAQQRMHNLQQQGIDRGFDESNAQYNRGQQATQDFIGAEGEYLNRGAAGRGEQSAFNSDRMGINVGRAGENMDFDLGHSGLGRDAAYGRGERELGALGQYYGTQQSILGNRMEDETARRKGMGDMYGSLIGAGAKYAAAGA